MSLTAGVGSFSVSANNAQLTYRRIEVEPTQLRADFNLLIDLSMATPHLLDLTGAEQHGTDAFASGA